MTSLSAVISTGISRVGHTECRMNGDIQNANPVARVNVIVSKYSARLLSPSSAHVTRRYTSGSGCLQRSFIPKAVDQSEVQAAKDYSSVNVDDNHAAQNAAEIAGDTVHGVANDRNELSEDSASEAEGFSRDQSQHFKGRGSILDAAADSANHAAQTIQRNSQIAGEFVPGSGTGDSVKPASENSGSAEELAGQNLTGTMKEKSNGIMVAEHETDMETDDNNAVQNAADMERETVTGLASARHEELEEGSSQDFGDQARHFQENVQEQAQGFVDSIKTGASRASKKVQAAGRDIVSRADHALGRSREKDEDDSKVLKLNPEDFEKAYIDIDDGSAKDSILL